MSLFLETDRLKMRKWTLADSEELYKYAKDPAVGPPAGWKPHESIEESRQIILELFIPNNSFAIMHKSDKKIIGSIGLEPDPFRPGIKSRELGYSLSREYWGLGIMTEAALKIIEYGFTTLSLDVISIVTSPENFRSQRVIEKCGFMYEGTLRYCYRTYDENVKDERVYSLLRKEWGA